jgi:CysZ protein
MFRAISLGFASLLDRHVILILLKVMFLTLLAFLLLGVGLWYGMDWVFAEIGLADGGLWSGIFSLFILLLLAIVLFRIVAVTITWVFADDIMDAVEERHYPVAAAKAARPDFRKSVNMAMKSAGRALGYNLLAFPAYLFLILTGVGAPLVFLIVNAFLLGRDLEDMLIMRHGAEQGVLGKGSRMLLGFAGTAAMMIPFLQFIVPVVATASAVHMIHGKRP